MSWTNIVVVATIWVIAGLVGIFMKRYIIPFLEDNNLIEAATVAVNAAEALYGRYHGEEKFTEALNQLKANGWDIDSEIVINAVRSAWNQLNLEQISVGVKEV